MFRKDRELTERSRTLLKGKETKALKSEVLRQFPNVNEEELNALLPNKVNLCSIKLIDRTILYAVDDIVLFFDVKGRNNLYPSVATLWKLPNMLPCLVTHSPVSRNLIRGADLMVPGVIGRFSLSGLHKGDKYGVRINGHPLPFAVGDICLDSQDMSMAVRGKAIDILHCYGDLLIPMQKVVLPPGFLKDVIQPVEAVPHDEAEEDEDVQDETDGIESDNVGESGRSDAVEAQEPQTDAEVSGAPALPTDDTQLAHAEETDLTEQVNNIDLDDAADADPGQSVEEATEHLISCAVLLVKHVVKDQHMPALFSTLWSQLPRVYEFLGYPGLFSQAVKRSVLRRPVQLLQRLQQVGFWTVSEQSPGVFQIRSVQRQHSLLRSHKCSDPEGLRAAVTASTASAAADDSEPVAAGDLKVRPSSSGPDKHKKSQAVGLVEVYKLPKKLQEVFADEYTAADSEVYGPYMLRSTALRQVFLRYLAAHPVETETVRGKGMLAVSRQNSAVLFDLFREIGTLSAVKSAPSADEEADDHVTHDADGTHDDEDDPHMFDTPVVMEQEDTRRQDADDAVEEEGGACDAVRQYSSRGYGPQDDEWAMKVAAGPLKACPDLPPADAAPLSSPPPAVEEEVPRGGASGVRYHKAVHLPPAPAPTSSSRTTAGKSDKNGGNWPRAGSNNNDKTAKNKSKDKQAAAAVAVSGADEAVLVSWESAFPRLLKALTPYHAWVVGNGEQREVAVRSGAPPRLQVLTEKRAGNKTVTLLRHLEAFSAVLDAEQFVKQAQKRFACSVALGPVPGIPQQREVVLQGMFAFEIAQFLQETQGVPSQFVEVEPSPHLKTKKR